MFYCLYRFNIYSVRINIDIDFSVIIFWGIGAVGVSFCFDKKKIDDKLCKEY